jgi:hypothetical protein
MSCQAQHHGIPLTDSTSSMVEGRGISSMALGGMYGRSVASVVSQRHGEGKPHRGCKRINKFARVGNISPKRQLLGC